MKTIFAIALCMGLAFATLTIPLQSKAIYYRDANSVDQLVDEVLYADSDFVHQTHNEDVVLDVQAKVNYLISRNTKLNQNAVNPNAFDCTAQCEQGDKQTGTFAILGGKVNVSGGVFLKGNTAVEVTDSNDEVEVELKVYVPETVESSTAPQENKILQSFNAGLSLARTDSFITALESSSKLVHHNQFSLYVHDKIAQLNVGGIQEYFVEPESPVVHVATNHSKGWSVTISGIKTKNGSLLKKDGQKIVAHWDLTSKYIFVPHIEAVNYINYVDPAHYYFMTSKELLCFQPSNNLGNQYSYVCSAEKFPGFEAFNDITFTFVGLDEKDIHVVLRPTDYISQQADGSYELLFRFSTSPQSINDFYFGTSFFNKFYATFNSDKGVITLRDKYTVDVPVNGWHLDDNYRIPVIVVGLVLALAAVIILLVILKRVKLEDPAGQIPMYSVYKPAVPVYQTGVNVSGFQPTVATSVYNPAAQNAVVSSQQLRQSQTQVRQSQTMVRNSQNYVRNY